MAAKKGRPTDYKPEYAERAYKLCLLGATDEEIADFFECAESTLNLWKKKHPEFSESIKRGKEITDMHVAEKLLNRAEGAQWTEDQAFKVKKKWYDKTGKRCEEEEVVTVPVKKAAPPDTTALIFWLKNRKSSKWRDKQEHELTGKDGKELFSKIEVKGVSSSDRDT